MKNTKTEINATEIDDEGLANVHGGFMGIDLRTIRELLRKLKLTPIPPVASND
ncbi:MAG: hypothetical protein RL033_3759 [Pseudomonadota bacterium]|jgi:hypothetical protein